MTAVAPLTSAAFAAEVERASIMSKMRYFRLKEDSSP